jgi:hypothetical protein
MPFLSGIDKETLCLLDEALCARVPVYDTFFPDSDDGGPGLAAEGAPMKQAILQTYIGTVDFNIVLIFGKTMPAPGLDYL